MVEKSDVVEECSSCARLKQEIEIARKDQASTLKMIKEKIMSTDKLIKKYQKKCDDFDKQAKLLNDMTLKKENCERNAEVLQEQLNHSLEVTEPQKKTITRLIQEKFVAEEKIQEMKQKNVDLEEVINHLRHELQVRDEKASSWKLDQQIQAKEIEKEKKRVEKVTKDLEKAKQEIKNGRALVREKNRELRAAARRCDNLDIQVKRMKDEMSHGKMQGSYRYSSRSKSKLSAKEVTKTRRTQQSGKLSIEKNAEPMSRHSADEEDIASDERPSLTSILDEMTKLDFSPLLSPLRPSLSDQEDLPESKDSSSESASSGDGFSSSSDSSDGEGGGSIGDLEEILELKLKEKDFTCTDTGPDDGLGINMENDTESDVSGFEETEKNAQDNGISTNDEQTIHEESKKNCLTDNKEIENNDLEERLFEREIRSKGEKAVVFDDRDKVETSSTILDSANIISTSGLMTASTSETSQEANLCDTTENMDTSSTFDSAANSEKQSKEISVVGVDKLEKIEDIDFKNNNLSLSSPKRNLKGNVLNEEKFTPNRNYLTSSERNEMMTDDAVHDAAVHDAPVHDAAVQDALQDAALQDAAVQDAAVEDAAVHDSAVHDGAVQGAAVQDAAVHDAAVQDAVQDAAVQDAAVQDAAVQDAALRDAALTDAALLRDAAEQDAAVQDAVVQDAALQDAAVQDALQDAAVQDAAVQDAAVQDAAVQDAAVQDAAVQDAAVQDAAVHDAAVQDAAVPDAAVQDGAVQDGAVHDAAVHDAAVQDAAVHDAAVQDAAVQDAAVQDAAVQDAAVQDAAVQDAAVQDAAVQDAAVQDATEQDTAVQDATVEDAAVEDAVVEDGAVQDAAVKDAAVHDAAVHDAAVHDAAVQDATVQDTGGIARVSARLDKPVTKYALTVFTALKDDDKKFNPASSSVADDDKISRSSKDKPLSETDIKCTKDNEGLLVTSNDLQCANDKFKEDELEADSGKENAGCMPLVESKNYGGNDVEINCNSSSNRGNMQAEGLSFVKDSLEESGKTLEKELMTEEYKHGEESVVTNEVSEESGLSENYDNVRKANTSSDTASDKVDPCVKQSRENKLESGSNDVKSEGALYYKTPSTRRRIAHQPKKKSETVNNSCKVNNSIKLSEEILPDNINKLKQTSTNTNFGDKLSDKSDLREHNENRKTSLQIPKDVDNGSRINEEENEIADRQADKTKRSTPGHCNVDKKKRTRTEKKSKASESTCEDVQKKFYSRSFSEDTCENDINENIKLDSNTDALSCTYDDNLQDDHVKDSLTSLVSGDKSRDIEADYSLNCHVNSTDDNTKLLSKQEAMEMENVCREAVHKEVPVHKSSTNNFTKDKELQCCDDTSLDKSEKAIMDKSTEEVIDEGETLVFDDACSDANTRLLGQVLLDNTKDVINNGETFSVDEAGNDGNTVLLGQVFPDSTKDAKDFVSGNRKLEENKEGITNLHFECSIEAQDSAIMNQVTSAEEDVFECNMEKLEPEADDDGCKTLKKKDVYSDGESDFNLISTNKPEQNKDKRIFAATNEKLPNFNSDTSQSKYPVIAVDALPLLSVIDDSLNLFDEKVPLLSPLPSSPASSRESSPVHAFEFETEHALSTVSRVSSSLSSAPKPSRSTKKQRVLENYGELERLEGEKNDCNEEDNPLKHEQIKNPSNKQNKKKRGTLSVRPYFITEIQYAEKVLRFLCKEQVKMDDVVARVSSPTSISDGTPLAAALVKFVHNEDLMPDIIQRYNDRDRQNDTHTSRLSHLTEWNPVLSFFETRVFQMVVRLSEVEHLQGLSTNITSLLNRSIIHSCSVAEGPVKKCVASKCRLLCILSRQESNLQRMRVLCYDIIRLLYTRPGTVLYLLISIAAVWPTVLSSLATACTTPGGLVCMSGENYQPLPCTIQTILTTWVRSHDWVLLGNVIEWLCAWKHVPFGVFSIEQLVEELVRLIKDPSFAHLMPGKDGFPVLGFGLYEVVKSLELVTCVLGWAWLNDTLIREVIWDILTSWASRTQPVMGNTAAALPHQTTTDRQSDAGNGVQTLIDSLQTSGENKGDMDSIGTGLPVNTDDTSNEKCQTAEATVVAAIRLLGLVCRIAIQQHQTSIPKVMPLLVGILERAQDCSVPYVVQFACAYSLLEISPWEPSQVYSVLEKWKLQQDERRILPKSLIQGLISLNLSLQMGRNYSLHSKRSIDTEEEDEEHNDSESDSLEM